MPPIKRRILGNSEEQTNTHKSNFELTRPSLSELEGDDLLYRPGFDSLTDGTLRSKIMDASIVKTNSNTRLRLEAEFFNAEGESLIDSFLLHPDWKPGAAFRELLEKTDLLPKPKEPLNLKGLVGQELMMTLKINVQNGRSYVNLVKTENIVDEFETTFEDTDFGEPDSDDQDE